MNTHEKALENLKVIRETMERSSAVTSVSGIGLIAMGIIAILGAFIASLGDAGSWWVNTWTIVAFVGCATGIGMTWRQSRTHGPATTVSAARRFGLALAPPILAGCVISEALFLDGRLDLLPGVWMLLYGAGVITAGAFSIRLIPTIGITFMVMGLIGLFLPQWWFDPFWRHVMPIDIYLAAGFGGLHIGFGWVIAKRYNS